VVGCFLSGIGILAILGGLLILGHAPNAIQETEGILSIGFGFVVIGLGGVVTAINTVSSILKRRLPIPDEPPAEPKKSWQDRLGMVPKE
jgi:hypothetical protein